MIAPSEKAIYVSEDGPREVTVIQHLFTPGGLMYSLRPERQEGRWMVVANALQPMHGSTKLLYVDLMTGETRGEAPSNDFEVSVDTVPIDTVPKVEPGLQHP